MYKDLDPVYRYSNIIFAVYPYLNLYVYVYAYDVNLYVYVNIYKYINDKYVNVNTHQIYYDIHTDARMHLHNFTHLPPNGTHPSQLIATWINAVGPWWDRPDHHEVRRWEAVMVTFGHGDGGWDRNENLQKQKCVMLVLGGDDLYRVIWFLCIYI